MKRSFKQNPWTTLETREVYQNPWIRVTERDVINPAGKDGIYGVVHFKNVAVGVLALDEENRILLVGQYRYPLDLYSWEIPEGGSPVGTSTLASAKRELKEETGYRARKWSKLLTLHLSNSSTDEKAEIFLASGLTAGESEPEETEELRTKWVKLKDAITMVEKGEITDAISVAAILRAARFPGLGRKKPPGGIKADKKNRRRDRNQRDKS